MGLGPNSPLPTSVVTALPGRTHLVVFASLAQLFFSQKFSGLDVGEDAVPDSGTIFLLFFLYKSSMQKK